MKTLNSCSDGFHTFYCKLQFILLLVLPLSMVKDYSGIYGNVSET